MTAGYPTSPVAALAIVGVLACGGSSVTSDAVMFRENPEHTGISHARFFAGQGGLRWQVQTDGAVRSSPAVSGDRIYISESGAAHPSCGNGHRLPHRPPDLIA